MATADKIGRTGRITTGEHAGFLVRIQDDIKNTGGFFVVIWQESPRVGYDYWVKDLSDLEKFLFESCWAVDWL
jgi:hypothetical protein